MTISEAITKAVEGGYLKDKIDERGWEWEDFIPENPHIKYGTPMERKYNVFLDPQFWKCLGKTMGWGNNLWIGEMRKVDGNFQVETHKWELTMWEYQWHRFIDHLSEGGTPESFFKELK